MLLVNLGTPDGTDYKSMRRYLKEFLSDSRVIEWPKAVWYPILHGIVLNTRPQKSGAAYREISGQNEASQDGPGKKGGAVPTYMTDQLANYQAALARLGGGG